MEKYLKNISVKDLVLDLLFTVIGTALVGFGLSIFTVPNAFPVWRRRWLSSRRSA